MPGLGIGIGLSLEFSGGVRAWTPALLPNIAPSIQVALSRSQGKLWQDVGKTVPAVSNGDLVYVATCPWTGFDWVAVSSAQRPTLTNISGAKWGLTSTAAVGGLLGPTQSAQASACTFSLRATETAATAAQRVIQDAFNAIMAPRRTSNALFSQGAIFAGQLVNDSNPHTTTMSKASNVANWVAWFDGVSQTVAANAFNFSRLSYARAGAVAEGHDGTISAFITTSNVLSASDRALLETYLATLQ